MTSCNAGTQIGRRLPYGRVSVASAISVTSVAVQLVLLVAVHLAVGLTPLAWGVAAVHLAVLLALVLRGLRRTGLATLGWANTITLARAQLAGVVLALAVSQAPLPPGTSGGPVDLSSVVLAATALLAVLLDGVDGRVARRTKTCSDFGARFDVEADAFLVLVLAGYVAQQAGWWVLIIGAMRYLFLAAALPMPWLAAPLPPRTSGKVIGLTQGLVLLVVAAGLLPGPVVVALLAMSLLLLVWSFGRDVLWLASHRE